MRSALPVVLGAALLLSACGSSSAAPTGEGSKSAVRVRKDAETAIRRARSVHAVLESGKPAVTMEVETVGSGHGGTVSFTKGRVHFDLIATGDGTVYIRGNNAYLLPNVAAALHGNWLKCRAGTYVGNFVALASAGLQLEPIDQGTPSNKGETTYKGKKVVEIDAATPGTKLYVAATGTPYPLALVTRSGTVTFGGFNAAVSLTPPKNATGLSKFCDGVIYQSAP
jgi:hypothetical protein